jgi:hypothetical protein
MYFYYNKTGFFPIFFQLLLDESSIFFSFRKTHTPSTRNAIINNTSPASNVASLPSKSTVVASLISKSDSGRGGGAGISQ